MAKRKKDEEYRAFQQGWTEEFAFVERAGSAVCLICNDKIASMKRSNISGISTHAVLHLHRNILRRTAGRKHVKSYCAECKQVSSNSVFGPNKRTGKPFTDGEHAETFMLDAASELFDDFSDKDKIIKRHIPHTAACEYCCADNVWLYANGEDRFYSRLLGARGVAEQAIDIGHRPSNCGSVSQLLCVDSGDFEAEEVGTKGGSRGEGWSGTGSPGINNSSRELGFQRQLRVDVERNGGDVLSQ
ncbi:hypothetical protein MHYP_G00353420 [Metynnis hypsauchen]